MRLLDDRRCKASSFRLRRKNALPCRFVVTQVGIFRLRNSIRCANRIAALKMTDG